MNTATLQLEQTFRLSLYGLAMFSGLILGLAEGGWLPYGTLFMAVIGYRLTESSPPRYLGSGLSNLAGLIAVSCAALAMMPSRGSALALMATTPAMASADQTIRLVGSGTAPASSDAGLYRAKPAPVTSLAAGL